MIHESLIWAYLAENIVLTMNIVVWALLCEFSIASDTQVWRPLRFNFCSKP